ncbi:MAG: penicillin-binding protein 1C [Anaerolineae bacterium]
MPRRRPIYWILGPRALVLVLLAALAAYQPGIFFRLPSTHAIRDSARTASSVILDRNGKLLYEIIDPHSGPHRPLQLDEMPLALRQAIVATEDASFYTNPGIDPWAIVRALWTNLRGGEIVSGGSTITQQLARNLLMSEQDRREITVGRKLREALLAYHLTRSLSKDDILAFYLNEVYLGNMAYGVEAASRAYFGKPVDQLDLAECALLAGLPQSPVAYNPLSNPAAAKERQAVVLALMVKSGYISSEQAALAREEPLRYASDPYPINAPHFVMVVRDELARLVGEEAVRRGGLRVHTTLDLDLQTIAETQVRRHLEHLNEESPEAASHNVRNAATVMLNPQTGAVRVMVGSPDYTLADIDGAVNATLTPRQPGSAIKPLTYAAAFARGYSPASMFTDVRTSFTTREGLAYVPVNYDYRFHGPVLLRQALACSYNTVAVQLLDAIGIDALTSTAHQLGIRSWDRAERYGLALTLGGGEVSLLQLTSAYGALANGGLRVPPHSIVSVEDAEGHVLYSHQPAEAERVLDARIAYLVTDVLADAEARQPAFGSRGALYTPFGAAVKTGTTTGWRDNWTIGYTSEWVVGVWVGNANNEPMVRVSGVSGAAPIWNALISAAQRRSPAPFVRPAGIQEISVCALSGLLPGPACSHIKQELFLDENAPTRTCALHRLVAFDAETGEPAAEDCPPERRVDRSVTIWPPEAISWAQEMGLLAPEKVLSAALASTSPDVDQAHASDGATRSLWIARPAANSRYAIAPDIPANAQRIEIEGVAAPELALAEVMLWIDGRLVHTWDRPPYRTFWALEPGRHEIVIQGSNQQADSLSSDSLTIWVVVGEAPEERTSS